MFPLFFSIFRFSNISKSKSYSVIPKAKPDASVLREKLHVYSDLEEAVGDDIDQTVVYNEKDSDKVRLII